MTIAELHKKIVAKLQPLYAEREARVMSHMLLEHFGRLSRAHIYAFPDTELLPDVVHKIETAVSEMAVFKPLQYVVGETTFCDCIIEVNEAVLIPRPETEELVDWVIQEFKDSGFRILDLCTGSGCIAVALAKYFPQATVYACDISKEALAVARRNAKRNQADVRFFECDLLSTNKLGEWKKIDCIVSNPPYVRQSEAALMAGNVLRYEPHLALFVDDNEPLIFYRAIATIAQQCLQKGGSVFVEINEALGKETKAVFEAAGFTSVELRKDINGKHRLLRAS